MGTKTYFIQQGDSGPIKIGRAGSIKQRIVQLQPGSPVRLHLRLYVGGDWEKEFHHRFRIYRIARAGTACLSDWFDPGRELIEFIEKQGSNKRRYGSSFTTARSSLLNALARFFAFHASTAELVDIDELCVWCKMTKSEFTTRWVEFPINNDDGRWYQNELDLWLKAHCPDCYSWETIRERSKSLIDVHALERSTGLRRTDPEFRMKAGYFDSEAEALHFIQSGGRPIGV